MKKIFVDYNSYLSNLFKLKENTCKGENDLLIEYQIYKRVYNIEKCGLKVCHKLRVPINTYFLKPILFNRYRYLSECGEQIVVEVTKEELAHLSIAFSDIYELENTSYNNYFIRNVDNLYLIEEIKIEELIKLADKEAFNYYNEVSVNQIKYVKEYDENNKISLVAIHDINNQSQKYFQCDEEYPEVLKDKISYLKIDSKEKYVEEELPERRNKKTFKRNLKK